MPAPEFSQFQKISQEQILSPQVLHALKILQVPAIELAHEIADEMAKNPLLEELPPAEDHSREALPAPSESEEKVHAETDDFGSDTLSFSSQENDGEENVGDGADFGESEIWSENAGENTWSDDAEKHREHLFNSLVENESLPQILESQIALSDAPDVTAEQLRAIAQNIDERGFLDVPVEKIAETLDVPVAQAERALRVFQNFDPPGIGARDLREAFLIQLRRQGRENSLAYRILDTDYASFLARKFPAIASKFGVGASDVREAIFEISKLKRVPAADFVADENREITPDLTFFFNSEKKAWDVRMENAYIPRLRISGVYKDLVARGKIPAKDRAYIAEKMRAGRFLINAIEQRQRTIEQIAHCIVAAQREFLESGPAKLRPMTMASVAAEIGVHETTVSRAVAGKYAETPHGVFELRRFFNAGLSTADGEALANAGVREILKEILDSEPSDKPLSDEKLAAELGARGIKVARRTIAKYRGMMNIPPAHLRKKF